MDFTLTADERQEISLLDSLTTTAEWLKLPVAVMVRSGPAAQTLAGLLKVTNRETYTAVATIARKARLPVKTVRKHLKTLHDDGWIEHQGRRPTRRGFLRRTATIKVTQQTKDVMEP